MDVTEGTGLLIHWDDQLPPRPRFLGTCFAYGGPKTYLTAAHCMPVDDKDARNVFVMRPDKGGMRAVLVVSRHPRADLAVLQVNPVQGPDEPFWASPAPCEIGDDFVAFGFPEDTINDIAGVPTARIFKGHVQRLFPLPDQGGAIAAEMSVPAPAGLSGGPVVERAGGAADLPVAVVLGNRESEIYVSRYENGDVIRAVTRYGTALLLEPLADWISSRVAPDAGEGAASSG